MKERRERRGFGLHRDVGHVVRMPNAFAYVASDVCAVRRTVEHDMHCNRIEAIRKWSRRGDRADRRRPGFRGWFARARRATTPDGALSMSTLTVSVTRRNAPQESGAK